MYDAGVELAINGTCAVEVGSQAWVSVVVVVVMIGVLGEWWCVVCGVTGGCMA